MKKIVIILSFLCILLFLSLLYVIFDKKSITNIAKVPFPKISMPKLTPEPTNTMLNELRGNNIDKEVNNTKEIKTDGVTIGGIKQGTIEIVNFKFTPDAFQVNEGDTITITIKSTQGVHNFVIEELGVRSKTLKEGESEEITFVPSKKGAFKFFDSLGQHRAMGLEGTIVVN